MKYFDGWLYAVIAFCGATSAALSTDEAFDLFTHQTLFWAKLASNSIGATALALKMWRSTAYAQIKEESKTPVIPAQPTEIKT